MIFLTRFAKRALAATALVAALSACSQSVVLESAPDANNPVCAEITVRLPDAIETLTKRVTTAQATTAWGEPAAVLLRCGIEPVELSSLRCVSIADVDWLVDESKAPSYRFITFGRIPATEVMIDSTKASGATVLDEIGGALDRGKVTKRCL